MVKITDYDVVFREIPDEISLAFNISNCPFRCEGCHSPYLQEDIGYELTIYELSKLIKKYEGITCVLFMGGDGDLVELYNLMRYIKENYDIKTAWYSGNNKLPNELILKNLDYVKIGSYMLEKGGLDSPTSNQVLYKIENGNLIDITYKFRTNFIDN